MNIFKLSVPEELKNSNKNKNHTYKIKLEDYKNLQECIFKKIKKGEVSYNLSKLVREYLPNFQELNPDIPNYELIQKGKNAGRKSDGNSKKIIGVLISEESGLWITNFVSHKTTMSPGYSYADFFNEFTLFLKENI